MLGYQPWPTAPVQDLSPRWGESTLYFTDQRIIMICPNFVPPNTLGRRGYERSYTTGSVSGAPAQLTTYDSPDGLEVLVDVARHARGSAKAARAVIGRAVAGAVPWEYVVEAGLTPDHDDGSVILGWNILAGEGLYSFGLTIPRADLSWARQQVEWSVGMAVHRRLATLGDAISPGGRRLLEQIQRDPRPEHSDDGSLSYTTPAALDANHALLQS